MILQPSSAPETPPLIDHAIHWAAVGVEVVGVAVLLVGIVAAGVVFVRRSMEEGAARGYHAARAGLGRSILLGLELLVAADIIETVSVAPDLRRVAVLAGIVLIRTFLSFSLEVEIDGHWPWQAKPEEKQGEGEI